MFFNLFFYSPTLWGPETFYYPTGEAANIKDSVNIINKTILILILESFY